MSIHGLLSYSVGSGQENYLSDDDEDDDAHGLYLIITMAAR